jgi:hypothetical protein
MTRPWEPGGTVADWAEVLPEHLEFEIVHNPEGRLVRFQPAMRPGVALGEMLKGWYGRHMPFWLEPVADSLYIPSFSAQRYSDAELGQFLINMHFWQHHLPEDPIFETQGDVEQAILQIFEQAATQVFLPPDIWDQLLVKHCRPRWISFDTVQRLLEAMVLDGRLALFNSIVGSYCLANNPFRVVKPERRSAWDRLLEDELIGG